MNLTWRTPSDLGGDPSTSYRVFIGTDIANLYPDSMVTGVWYNFTNLIKGTTYFISVKAVNARGEGPSSQVLNGTPRSRPSPPTSLSYTQGDGFINVSWSPPKDDGGAPLLGYSVYLGTSRTDLSKKETQLEGRYLLIEGLINGRIYYVAAAVENSLGSSEMSDVLEAVPMTYPSAPVLVNHSAGDGWIEVSWEEPLDDGGSPIWLYHILLGTDGSDPVLYKIVSPTVRSYRIVGLENGRKYSVSLSCENSFGSSQPTVPIELIPQPEKEDTDVPILLFVAAGIAAVILLAAVLAIYLNIRSSRRERFLRMYRERKRREE
jgi:titin